MSTETGEQTSSSNLGAETQGSVLSVCKRSENVDTDDNSQGTMKGDEIVDEASSIESDADKVAKESDNCARDIPMEEESNLEDPASSETTSSDQPPSAQANNILEGADGSKLASDASRSSDQQCYCGKGRNMNVVELQCIACLKWFHDTCLSLPLGKCVPFMTNYTFSCKLCNPAGNENFSKKQSNFSQMCVTALANLIQKNRAEGGSRALFSKDKEIIPFIEKNWENMTTVPRRVKQTWHTTVYKTMTKDTDVFVCEEKTESGEVTDAHPYFGLILTDLEKIGPNYESLVRGSQGRNVDSQVSSGNPVPGKGRGTKRKLPGESQTATSGKKNKSDLVMPKLPPNGYPLDHPYNKDGYRYILAEPDPHAPFRQEFDESTDCAGKPIPAWLYRKLQPSSVLLAMHDRAPQLKLSDDRLSVTGEKGYCMVRATHGVEEGAWYFEATIEDMPENCATRIGWSQELGNLQAPLGYDRFGYAWRSRKGTKFHESRGYHYHDGGYGTGDTLGFLIELPRRKEKEGQLSLPDAFKDRRLVKVKSYLYFEEKDEVQQAIKALRSLPGSRIVFYKNGECIGTAWKDIYEGMYYPAVSLYKGCTVRLNFGPNFKHKPKDVPCLGMHESVDKVIVQQTMSDILYLVENESQMRLDAIYF
ncbi:set1/Ash2 histone methyltransferase complex subunit ASH2 [Dermacentor andersoni]|uniref:set1/Ash2 histone methyltransferase complex subunit ASH2 n=1 Tax=Dermacentor andersoni TaxID=34620 RepID=UPI0021551A36|nr:set1/Ash2 histone methyltransferase complex subunit ASH2-like [Dermacentor andersoni]